MVTRKSGMGVLSLVAAAFLMWAAPPAWAQAEVKAPVKAPLEIKADTTWSGARMVDQEIRVSKGTLTLEAGTTLQFRPGGFISVARDAALTARGTEQKPVMLTGEHCGHIYAGGGKVLLEHCDVTGLGDAGQNRELWLQGQSGQGVTLSGCRLTDCGFIWLSLSGPFLMDGCDLRKCRGDLYCWGEGQAAVTNNTVEGAGIGISGSADAVVRNNVVIGGSVSLSRCKQALIEGNYVHQPVTAGRYGVLHTVGTIRDNVVRGGSWVSSQIGGEITGNVLISMPHEGVEGPGEFDKNCTHEHICGLVPNSRVVRNLFVGASYGAVMGIGPGTASDSVIRNNTFDSRGRGLAIYLNHLPASDPKNIVIRNNLFMRGGAAISEKDVPDSVKTIDYNLWSDAGRKERFRQIVITGKNPGDEGFGKHDVPPPGRDDEQPAPGKVVVNPDVKFPFPDDQMLDRRHTPAEVLAVYRQAYALVDGSPAIDAGDPAAAADTAVTDGKPDIGAIEHRAD